MRRLLFLLLFLLLFGPVRAATFTVNNCAATLATAGSLPWAAEQIKNSSDTTKIIEFNIPTTEAGYITTEVTGVGFWRITPTDKISMSEDIEIRGSTQASNQGDQNPFGPEIVIDGSSLPAADPVFDINNINRCTIEGLTINQAQSYGITISVSNNNNIFGCYIGTDATGEAPAGNLNTGIYLIRSDSNTIGGSLSQRNIISGNTNYGIVLNNSSKTTISNNIIGASRSGSRKLGNGRSGIYLEDSAGLVQETNIIGGGNIISGNNENGIELNNSKYTNILDNFIGTNGSGSDVGNAGQGVLLRSGAQSQYIAGHNVIAFNGGDGIRIDGSSTNFNTSTQNSYFLNGGLGIALANGGNSSIAYPVIATAEYYSTFDIPYLLYVQGSGPANSTIEIMKVGTLEAGTRGEGEKTIGFALSDGNGNWLSYLVTNEVQPGDILTALATDQSGNTSEFSLNQTLAGGTVIYRPDGMIGLNSDGTDYTGVDVFNTTGYGQTKSKIILNSQAAIYYVKVKNAGNISPDNIRITGTGDSADWQIKYFDSKAGSNEITSQVTGSGYVSSSIPSAESFEFRVEAISTGSTASTKEVLVTLASASNPSRLDVVKATAVAQTPVATDQFTFVISAPSTCEADAPFKLTVIAYNAAGQVTTEVVGRTSILVDQGTVAPASFEASGFSQSGIWYGQLSLSQVGIRTITLNNSFITQRATAVIEVLVPGYVQSGGLMRFGPNPFSPVSGQEAIFWYWLNEDKATTLYLFDMQGDNLYKQAFTPGSEGGKRGVNAVRWNGQSVFGRSLDNGVYFYRIAQDNKVLYKGKLIILR